MRASGTPTGIGGLAILTLLLGSGCASTTTFSQWKPAELDVGPIRRVVVAPVQGPEDLAAEAEATLVADLRNSGQLEVLTVRDLPPLAGGPMQQVPGALDRAAAIHRAARAQADAVLLATLVRRVEGGMDLGSVTIRFGEPTTQVAMRFELIDARTGQSLARDQAVESFTGEFEAGASGRYVEQRVMQDLVVSNAHQVLGQELE